MTNISCTVHVSSTSFAYERSSHSEDIISFADVDIISTSEKLLAGRLSCNIIPGESLLVTGPNGSGKSSFFRVLRGLWPTVSGRLVKPSQLYDNGVESDCGIFVVPQRPYTCLGNLRDQIIYPLSREEAKRRGSKEACAYALTSADY